MTREVNRGERLHIADVRVRQVPADEAWEGAFHSPGQVEGLVAQTALDRGEPLFTGDISPAPVAPDGHTVLEVRVASQAAGLVAGDTVSLAVAGNCGGSENTNETGNNGSADDMGNTVNDENDAGEQADDATPPGVCVLAREALVMDEPRQPEDGTPGDVLSLAMEPQAALTVMERQEATAIIALHRQADP